MSGVRAWKSGFVLSCILFFSVSVFSQENDDLLMMNEPVEREANSELPTSRFINAGNSFEVEYFTEYWRESVWVYSSQRSTDYDFKRNRSKSLTREWIDTISSWKMNKRSFYTYDSADIHTETITQSLRDTTWVNDSRDLYHYDLNGNLKARLQYGWRGNVWVENWKTVYDYDANNNNIEKAEYRYRGQTITKYKRWQYVYDSSRQMVDELYSTATNNEWTNKSKRLYTYSANGKLIFVYSFSWKKEEWTLSSRSFYYYDESENISAIESESWIGGEWAKNSERRYSYSVKGNQKDETYYNWQDGLLVPFQWISYKYDFEGNQLERTYRYWSDSRWINSSRYRYVFSPLSVDERELILKKEIVLTNNYPNPFNPSTIIRYELPARSYVRISVFNLLGQEVATLVDGIEDAGMKSVQWDASQHGIPSGVYFYKLQSGASNVTKKMLLLR